MILQAGQRRRITRLRWVGHVRPVRVDGSIAGARKEESMPVELLSDDQAARYGQYTGDPTPAQLARYLGSKSYLTNFLRCPT